MEEKFSSRAIKSTNDNVVCNFLKMGVENFALIRSYYDACLFFFQRLLSPLFRDGIEEVCSKSEQCGLRCEDSKQLVGTDLR